MRALGRRTACALGAILLGACSPTPPAQLPERGSSTATASVAAAATTADDVQDVGNACREQVADFKEWLRAVEATGWPLAMSLLDEGARLVPLSGASVDDPAPILHLTADKAILEGVPIALGLELEQALTKLIALQRRAMERSPFIASPRCYVAVNADVPWSRVVSATQHAAAAGIVQASFVFTDPKRIAPKLGSSAIDADLRRMDKASAPKRQQILAELIAYVYQDCPDALRVIAQLSHEVADMKQVILDELPDAIGACACSPDGPSVRALHWALFGNPHPAAGVTVFLAADKQNIAAAADTLWSESHRLLVQAATTAGAEKVRLQLADPPKTK